jgi:hypothetical protein
MGSTGFCLFARPPVFADPKLVVDLINGLHGWGWTTEDLERLNITTLQDELEFNRRAGFTEADARPPEHMTVEPLPRTTRSSMCRMGMWTQSSRIYRDAVAEIRVFGALWEHLPSSLNLDLEGQKATVGDLLACLGIDPGEVGVVTVGGRQSSVDGIVPAEARVCVFLPMFGG